MTKEEHAEFERKRLYLIRFGVYQFVKGYARENGYKIKYLLQKMPESIFHTKECIDYEVKNRVKSFLGTLK